MEIWGVGGWSREMIVFEKEGVKEFFKVYLKRYSYLNMYFKI